MPKTENQVTCNNCNLDEICFPRGLSKSDVNDISHVIKSKKTLHRGDSLFQQGDRFRGLLAIKSGTAKLVANDYHGNEHILNVLLPGELLGFDGIYNEKYKCSAIALETLCFCELPAQGMEKLFQNIPTLSRELFRHASKKIMEDKEIMVLNKRSAEERLASFLISLSDRLKQRGFSSSEFTLSLTRQEIGNHLGLALETVSRLLKKFQREGLIDVKSKEIKINSIPKLRAIFTYTE
jgi:CRP/FNR family transcriptional regulator